MASTLVAYAHGEDKREVTVDRVLKSVGHDQTFATSLRGLDAVIEAARTQAAVVARALRGQNRVARTITVVVRFDDLTSVSRSQTLPFGIDDEVAVLAIAEALLQSIDLANSVRLLAIHASSFLERDDNNMQLTFGLDPASTDPREQAEAISRERQVSNEALRDAVDDVREKFGRAAVGVASELSRHGIEIATQRGSSSFGPEEFQHGP